MAILLLARTESNVKVATGTDLLFPIVNFTSKRLEVPSVQKVDVEGKIEGKWFHTSLNLTITLGSTTYDSPTFSSPLYIYIYRLVAMSPKLHVPSE